MKIAIITSNLNIGGPTSLIDSFCSYNNDCNEIYIISLLNDFNANILSKININVTKVYFCNKKKGRFSISFLFQLRKVLKKINPDLIWGHLSGCFYSYICGFNSKLPRVHTIHSLPLLDQNAIQRIILKHYAKKSLSIVGCCNYISNQSLPIYKVRPITIYNGAPLNQNFLNRNYNDPNDNCFKLIMCSRIIKMKRIDIIIKALDLLINSGHKVCLTIAGDGPELSNINSLIFELGIQDHVNYVSSDIFSTSIFACFDLLCISSEWEAFPITIIEAMSFGVPCLANDLGGINEIVKNGINGYLIKSNSPDQYAMAIQNIISGSNLSSLKKNAFETSKLFSIERCFKTYMELFEDITRKTK